MDNKAVYETLQKTSHQLKQNRFAYYRVEKLLKNVQLEKTDFEVDSINPDNLVFIIGDKLTGTVISYSATYFEAFPIKVGDTINFEKDWNKIKGDYLITKWLDNQAGVVEYLCVGQ